MRRKSGLAGKFSLLAHNFFCQISCRRSFFNVKFILLAAILFDRIWWCRNEIIFNKKTSDPRETVLYITKSYLEHLKAWNEKSITGFWESNWKPPSIGWLKFNFDVAIHPNKNTIFVCCRNDNGEILHACSKPLHAGDPAWGEAHAIFLAISITQNMEGKFVLFEEDAINIIEAF